MTAPIQEKSSPDPPWQFEPSIATHHVPSGLTFTWRLSDRPHIYVSEPGRSHKTALTDTIHVAEYELFGDGFNVGTLECIALAYLNMHEII